LALADDTYETAAELLVAFTDGEASPGGALFDYSTSTRIVHADIRAVGTEATTLRYSGQQGAYREVNNILTIRTADGYEGQSGVDSYYQGAYSDAHLRQLREAVSELVKLHSLDPVVISGRLARMRPDFVDEVRASIDIALWDLAARKAGVPLYSLLGARRQSIEAYASLPYYETLPEYIDAVETYAGLGYARFKFHVWGDIEKDIRLVQAVQQAYADSSFRFMMDLEGVYDYKDALRLGKQMDAGLFLWLEAPIDDTLLTEYGHLRDALDVLLIPAGYNVYSPEFIRGGIGAGAWDAARFDSTVVGGISDALKLLVVANAAGMPVDIQSWGHSLAQAANLHLMLANERTLYFESPMPKPAFEFGMHNGDLLQGGRVVAPDGPGLGIMVDPDALESADFYHHIELEFHNGPGER